MFSTGRRNATTGRRQREREKERKSKIKTRTKKLETSMKKSDWGARFLRKVLPLIMNALEVCRLLSLVASERASSS